MWMKCYTIFLAVIPVIKEVPKVVTITKKKTVVIECRVQSVFEPKCVWVKETTAVREDSRHAVKIEQVKDVSIAL